MEPVTSSPPSFERIGGRIAKGSFLLAFGESNGAGSLTYMGLSQLALSRSAPGQRST